MTRAIIVAGILLAFAAGAHAYGRIAFQISKSCIVLTNYGESPYTVTASADPRVAAVLSRTMLDGRQEFCLVRAEIMESRHLPGESYMGMAR